MQKTCGCRLNKGSPCSNLIPLEKYVCHHSETASLTRDQLDLVLIGAVMSVLNSKDELEDHSHKSKVEKESIQRTYLVDNVSVAAHTNFFLVSAKIGKASYMKDGITTRIHGNTKRLPHNALTYEDITRIVKFLSNYAKEQAILLPGRVPGRFQAVTM